MQLPLFIMHIQMLCEQGNRDKLLEDHLAYEHDPSQPLTPQIEKVLRKAASCINYHQDPDWKLLLLEKIEELRSKKHTILTVHGV